MRLLIFRLIIPLFPLLSSIAVKAQEGDKLWIKVVDDSTNIAIGFAHIYSPNGIDTLANYLDGTINIEKYKLKDSLSIGDNDGHKYVTIKNFNYDSIVVKLKHQNLQNASFDIPFRPLKSEILKDGTKKVFYPNFSFITYYNDGMIRALFFNGNYRFWNKNKRLISQSISLSSGILYESEWYSNGAIRFEGQYNIWEKKRVNDWKFYTKKGKVRIKNYR